MPTPTSGGVFSYVLPTGNSLTDPELGGARWEIGATTTTVTYSFPTSGSYWSTDSDSGYGASSGVAEPWNGLASFTAQHKAAVQTILGMISSLANINFVEVSDNSTTAGDLRFAFTSYNGGYSGSFAHAYSPSGSYYLSTYAGDTARASSGDVWISGKTVSAFNPVAGSHDYFTLIHEIGHALGLKHPHEAYTSVRGAFGTLASLSDATWNTVMSYNAAPGVKDADTSQDIYPTTAMKLDVAALQYLYGTNTASAAGNSIYTFRQDQRYDLVIYDTGGSDTIVYDATSAGGKLDLRAGAWQNVGLPIGIYDAYGGTVISYKGLVEIIGTADSIENATGGGGADTIIGNTLANVLLGGGGNDTITGAEGNDSIDGGEGIDSASFSGNRASYTLAKTTSGWTLASSAEGADVLTGIERLSFADKTVALDINGNSGQAYRIYQAAFDRTPDNSGLKYWISVMDNGSSLETVASGFLVSNEFTALYGVNPTNREFVSRLYSNVLHRAPDQGGFDYWVGILDTGVINKTQTLVNFSESNENQLAVIGVIQNGIELL